MEKSLGIGLDEVIFQTFKLKETEPETYSPLVLAYIGDNIFDLIIKSIILNRGNRQVEKLHRETSDLVQASTQSALMRTIQPLLTTEELAIYKRGRNAKSVSPAKNQSITDYRRATGFEALVGYLYLKKEFNRLTELVRIALEALEGFSYD